MTAAAPISRPDVVAFDVVGTLFSLGPVAARLQETGLPEGRESPKPITIARVLDTFRELPPHSDVRPAFERLEAAGIRIVTLTNGAARTTEHLLQRAGLEAFVEQTISIDEIRRWKPRREVYLHAAQVTGVPPARLALVAAHAWDIVGANAAGLITGWVAREETVFHQAMGEPAVAGRTLIEIAEALAAAKEKTAGGSG
jgi:2-haloacid dehalogenase